MKYLEDMTDKYGFGDGGNVPPDAYAARSVYTAAINKIAASLGSNTRALMYDRPGMHNGCMILSVRNDTGIPLDQPTEDVAANVVTGSDELFHEALSRAAKLDLDDLVDTVVKVDQKGLARMLAVVLT